MAHIFFSTCYGLDYLSEDTSQENKVNPHILQMCTLILSNTYDFKGYCYFSLIEARLKSSS